ncbi:hypothetical protein FNH22_29905 [Fulvivirga sp. M361]|uniref:hypothetical protein n=1 Tax=Fulvivirga sp. M361 TaxID=2594266 RepID=UPI00117B6A3F|nr:hypothetical protein [Fulvivirga sp. M361]TRX47989.1 hypothetical protein FNH22_29905 [Fulvivirga sp. M361]
MLLIKCLAGIAVGLMYTYYYPGGDTFVFHERAGELAVLARADIKAYLTFWVTSDQGIIDLGYTWSPNIFFIKIVSLFSLFTGHNYWLTSLYFSLISFSGLWHLALLLSRQWSQNLLAVLLALFCVPTVLFWSSGLTKESLTLALIASILFTFLNDFLDIKKITFLGFLKVFLLFVVLWQIRYYYAGLLIVVIFASWVTRYIKTILRKEHLAGLLSIFCFSCFILFFAVSFLHPNFCMSRILEVIVENHDAIIMRSRPRGMIIFSELQPDIVSITKNLPLAFFSAFFRPFIGENASLIYLIPGFEGLALMVLAPWSIFQKQVQPDGRLSILIIATIAYCIILGCFLALSAPNFGALVRYRIGFMPFLYLLVMVNNPWLKKQSERMFH